MYEGSRFLTTTLYYDTTDQIFRSPLRDIGYPVQSWRPWLSLKWKSLIILEFATAGHGLRILEILFFVSDANLSLTARWQYSTEVTLFFTSLKRFYNLDPGRAPINDAGGCNLRAGTPVHSSHRRFTQNCENWSDRVFFFLTYRIHTHRYTFT